MRQCQKVYKKKLLQEKNKNFVNKKLAKFYNIYYNKHIKLYFLLKEENFKWLS